ncbi:MULTISPECIES: PqqD family protein [Bacillus]|uniref:PqqD family protein n=1 Tax=Bacillus TaxID=1386 RepID=UPI00028EADB1|nr:MULTISPECIES: PqqD family protein [Bacillus]EKF36481.1 coenzyme PQQ biosynthesis protein PqqD [Bacillus xiamenensis]MBD3861253.1 PqqD family protein [Bacillus sp. 28A-2]MCW1837939.1 PqqD family protein [Bacillus xiamenensis]
MIPKKHMFVKHRSVMGKEYLVNKREAFQLDDVGAVIWRNINGKDSPEVIAKNVAEHFSCDEIVVKDDVNEYINELVENNLVKFL